VGIQCVDCVKEAAAAQRPVRSRLGLKVASGPPVVTYALVALNVAAYLYGLSLGTGVLFSKWGLWPHYDATHPHPYGGTEWWRWISDGFVHVSILHIGMNMFVLVMFGRQVEMLLGRMRFIVLYAVSLLGSSALVAVLGDSGSVNGGASGAIYGLIAGYVAIAMTLRLPVQSLVLQAGAWLVIGFFVPGLSWQGHLGGALTGWVVTAVILRLASRGGASGAPSP
jgi:membrane associated rhomboid family serine protease